MHRGYLALWRKIQDHPFYKERREFSKLEAWIDILMEVQHDKESKKVIIGMTVLTCNYGESLNSIFTWAKRWRWHESKVRRFFKLLSNLSQISTKSEGKTTRLTVLNYRQYDPKATSKPTEPRRAFDEHSTTDNNVKNDKNDNIVSTNVDMSSSTTKKLNHSKEINAVFDYYKSTLNHPRAKLDEKRKRCVRMRLQNGYSVDDIKIAIDGCLASPYHQGENKRNQVYDSLELICRDAEHIDRFIKLAKDPNAKLISAKGRQARQNGQTWLQMRQAKREDQNG